MDGILMVIGNRQRVRGHADCGRPPHWWANADIFTQLAQLTIIKENETLRLVCERRERRGEKRRERLD